MAYNSEYPYTDPYRYNDDWLLGKMRELIEEWAAMKGQFVDLQKEFNELKTYIMNYFANLNVQDEVETILNKWLSNGTISSLLRPLVNVTLGPWIWSRKGVIVIGDEFMLSQNKGGVALHDVIIGGLDCVPSAVLATNGASLMTEGELSYYNIANNWLQNNADFYQKGYRYLIIQVSYRDKDYSNSAIIQRLSAFYTLFQRSITVLLLVQPTPNINPKPEVLNFIRRLRLLAGFSGNNIHIPDMPLLTGESFYNSDQVTLTPSGTQFVGTLYLDKLVMDRTVYESGALILTNDEGVEFRLHPIDYFNNSLTVMVSLSVPSSPSTTVLEGNVNMLNAYPVTLNGKSNIGDDVIVRLNGNRATVTFTAQLQTASFCGVILQNTQNRFVPI